MNDIEMTKCVAEKMGLTIVCSESGEHCFVGSNLAVNDGKRTYGYCPLINDAQAMALVRRFNLAIQPPQFVKDKKWHVWSDVTGKGNSTDTGISPDLNRAICLCVSTMP